MLELHHVSKTYKSKKGLPQRALNNVSIVFPDKGFVFIAGKSGSGKTTLLNVMSGLDKCDSGEIIIENKKQSDFEKNDYSSYLNNYIGFIFQDLNMIESLSVYENIALPIQLQGKEPDREKIIELLKMVELSGLEDRMSNQLSGGQRQRVAVARALIKDPKIIMADEPTGSLDKKTGILVMDILKEISKDKLVIVVSHDTDNALVYGDQIIELADGKVVANRKKIGDVDLKQLKKEYQKHIDDMFVPDDSTKNSQDGQFIQTITKMPIKQANKIAKANILVSKGRFILIAVLVSVALGLFGISLNIQNFDHNRAAVNTFSLLDINTLALVNTVVDENNEATNTVFTRDEVETIESEFSNKLYKGYACKMVFDPYTLVIDDDTYTHDTTITCIGELDDNINQESLENFYHAKLVAGKYPTANENAIEILISDYIADGFLKSGVRISPHVVLPDSQYEDIINSFFEYSNYFFKIVGIFQTEIDLDYSDDSIKTKFYEKYINKIALARKDSLIEYATRSDFVPSYTTLTSSMLKDSDTIVETDSAYIEPLFSTITKQDDKYSIKRTTDYSGVYSGVAFSADLFTIGNKYKQRMTFKATGGTFTNMSGSYRAAIISSYYIDGIECGDTFGTVPSNVNLGDGNEHTLEVYFTYRGQQNATSIYSIHQNNSILFQMNLNLTTNIDIVISHVSFSDMSQDGYQSELSTDQYTNVAKSSTFVFKKTQTVSEMEIDLFTSSSYDSSQPLKDDEIVISWYMFNRLYKYHYLLSYTGLTDEIVNNKTITLSFTSSESRVFKIVGVYNNSSAKALELGKYSTKGLFISKAIADQIIEESFTPSMLFMVVSDDADSNYDIVSYLTANNIVYGSYVATPLGVFKEMFILIEEVLNAACVVLFLFAIVLIYSFIVDTIKRRSKDIGIILALGGSGLNVAKIYVSESILICLISIVSSIVMTYVCCGAINYSITKYWDNLLSIVYCSGISLVQVTLVCILVVLLSSIIPLYKLIKQKPMDVIKRTEI